MTPEEPAERRAAAGLPPEPDHAAIVAAEPGLAEVRVRDIVIAGVHAWVHGGAFITGDLDMPESHWVGLSVAVRGIPVLAIDYRKCVGGGALSRAVRRLSGRMAVGCRTRRRPRSPL